MRSSQLVRDGAELRRAHASAHRCASSPTLARDRRPAVRGCRGHAGLEARVDAARCPWSRGSRRAPSADPRRSSRRARPSGVASFSRTTAASSGMQMHPDVARRHRQQRHGVAHDRDDLRGIDPQLAPHQVPGDGQREPRELVSTCGRVPRAAAQACRSWLASVATCVLTSVDAPAAIPPRPCARLRRARPLAYASS